MAASGKLLVRLYAQLLTLHPRRYRQEYRDELQTVFSLVVDEAAERSAISLLGTALREFRDLPGALIREHIRERRKRGMETQLSTLEIDERPGRWTEVLAGIWPFLIWGPGAVILAYLPVPLRRYWGAIPGIIVFALPILIGMGIGWIKKFPRWSYPYVGLVLGSLAALGLNPLLLFSLIFPRGSVWSAWAQILIALGYFILACGLLLLTARRWHPLKPLYQGIRQDWTRLSFGLFTLAAVLFGGIDHEEDPTLTIYVIAPTIILALGALLYLRSTAKSQRILALLFSLLLAVSARLVGGKLFYGLYGMTAAAIIFIPALLELLTPLNKPATGK
jgi:hypothetical protein